MKPPRVTIPVSPLGRDLARAEAIRQTMHRLLIELETAAAGHAPLRPGYWRHHPRE